MSVNFDTNRPLRERLRSLHYHRSGNRTLDEHPAFARIHQLESVLLEGQLWDAYDMEIEDSVTGKSAYGKCLWYGPRLSQVLLEGGQYTPPSWSSYRPSEYDMGSDTVSTDSRGVPLGRSRGLSQMSIPTQGYRTAELSSEVLKAPDMLSEVTEQMANLSLQESPAPKRPRHHLGR